jgi:hypothetical protein
MLGPGVAQYLLVMHAALGSRAMMLKTPRINCSEVPADKDSMSSGLLDDFSLIAGPEMRYHYSCYIVRSTVSVDLPTVTH